MDINVKDLTRIELEIVLDLLFFEIKERFGSKIYDQCLAGVNAKIELLEKYLPKEENNV